MAIMWIVVFSYFIYLETIYGAVCGQSAAGCGWLSTYIASTLSDPATEMSSNYMQLQDIEYVAGYTTNLTQMEHCQQQ